MPDLADPILFTATESLTQRHRGTEWRGARVDLGAAAPSFGVHDPVGDCGRVGG